MVFRIEGEFAGSPLYRYLGYQEASDLHANYREGTVADFHLALLKQFVISLFFLDIGLTFSEKSWSPLWYPIRLMFPLLLVA